MIFLMKLRALCGFLPMTLRYLDPSLQLQLIIQFSYKMIFIRSRQMSFNIAT